MADKRIPENKSDAPPVGSTTDAQRQAGLTPEQKARQRRLAESGYILPAEFFAGEEETLEREANVAKNQPSTRPKG